MVVALVLAIGICTALNMLIIAVAWDAIYSADSGISENATQILTGWGGGILGVIGALVGYKAGETRREDDHQIAKDTAHAAVSEVVATNAAAAPVVRQEPKVREKTIDEMPIASVTSSETPTS